MIEARKYKPGTEEMLEGTGFTAVKDSGKTIRLTQVDLPWSTEEPREVHLALVTLQANEEGKGKVYIGSAVEGKVLREEAKKAREASEITDKQFYKAVALALQRGKTVMQLPTNYTPHTILYPFIPERKARGSLEFSNNRHTRTYFMLLANEGTDKIPTFIRVALSTAKSDAEVKKILSRNSPRRKVKSQY